MSEAMAELGEAVEPTLPPPETGRTSGFAKKVAAIFATRLVVLGVHVLTSLSSRECSSPRIEVRRARGVIRTRSVKAAG